MHSLILAVSWIGILFKPIRIPLSILIQIRIFLLLFTALPVYIVFIFLVGVHGVLMISNMGSILVFSAKSSSALHWIEMDIDTDTDTQK
jgi:hypothetical protein